jgi:hypothetical protein
MRRLVDRAVAFVPGLRGLTAGSRLRLAVLTASAALVALGAGALLVLGDSTAPKSVTEARPGGETVIAKFAQAKTQTSLFAEPTPVNRLLSMALAPMPTIAPPRKEEPNLAGLSEIPQELIWNRPEKKEDGKQRASFAKFSNAQEQLPWDAVEPVPFTPIVAAKERTPTAGGATTTAPAAAARAPVKLARGDVGSWLEAKVREIKGADRSRPLYHFELWLEPPPAVKARLVGVSYDFNSPAIRPQSQSSSDRGSGFRISAGGLACADEIVVTLRFDDGRVETAAVDGCKLLS